MALRRHALTSHVSRLPIYAMSDAATWVQIKRFRERCFDVSGRVLSSSLAKAVEANHDHCDEREVLIELVSERTGVASWVLAKNGVTREAVHETLARFGREPTAGLRCGRVLASASEEARRDRVAAIDSGHLLLGLLFDSEGVPARALSLLGLTFDSVRSDLDLLRAREKREKPTNPQS